MSFLNYRQIHLDFHTSEKIQGIGKNFSREQFQSMLQRGHVNSITLFSKCHHGWAYHPSKANTTHPHLEFDLLQAQIQAAHQINVKTPVYISAGLDEKLVRAHPDWLIRSKDEKTTWTKDLSQPGYHVFCFNSPYLDILIHQIEEVVERYDADGIFLDIVKPMPCYCQNCIQTLLKEGKDPYDYNNIVELSERTYANYTARTRAAVDKYKPGLPIFHNGGHIVKGRRDLTHMNTHLELESLPTGGWGYDHFPSSAKYAMTQDQEYLGMTGKFHTTWGEFGGFKHPNALIYETSLSIAMGAKCSIGDQLHPEGLMDPLTYDIIGQAYELVEVKEPWCQEATGIADIAILAAESLLDDNGIDRNSKFLGDIGANRMMLQSHYLYEIIDTEADFDHYKVLILPDVIRPNATLTQKIQAFIQNGGKILATGESTLAQDKDEFTVDLGVEWVNRCLNKPNYYHPSKDLGPFLPTSMVMYSDCEEVSVTTGVVHGEKEHSYFNRTTFEFCSHQHTPSTMAPSGPGMIQSNNSVYIPWKLFTEFTELGSLHLREMVTYALDLLLAEDKILRTNLPSQGIISYMHQAEEQRNILHLLYATPTLRGSTTDHSVTLPLEVIEDLIPLHNTTIELKVDGPINKLYLAPQNIELAYTQKADIITFNVDKFTCHQMIVVE